LLTLGRLLKNEEVVQILWPTFYKGGKMSIYFDQTEVGQTEVWTKNGLIPLKLLLARRLETV
jgi:hypothetical protein